MRQVGSSLRRQWARVALITMVFAAAVGRILIDRGVKAPVVLCDEFIYANLAKNLVEHGSYLFRGVPSHHSYAYPLLIAPAWLWSSMAATYALAKAIGACSMTLVALPVYVWARRFVAPGYALLAAALTLLVPGFFYSGLLMTEAAFLPAYVLASFAIALALERQTLFRQAAALAAVGLAVSVRVQALSLVAVIPTAAAVKFVLDARSGRSRRDAFEELRSLWPTGAVLLIGGGLYIAYKQIKGEALASGLGAYQGLAQLDYSLVPSVEWAVKHLAEVGLAVGFAPLAALIVLAWLMVRGQSTSPAERAFVAVALAGMLWMLLEVGAFAATVTPFIFERYTFYLEPLLIIALVAWLQRGLPRPLLGTVVALTIPLVLVMLLDLNRVVVPDPVNAVTMDSLYKFSLHLPGRLGELRLAILGAAALAAFLFALCAKPVARVALPALVAAYFVAASWSPLHDVHTASASTRAAAGSDPVWITRALGHKPRVLYANTPTRGISPSNVLLATEFWNRNVTGVYSLGAREICPLPETAASIDPSTGRIGPPLPGGIDHVVVDRTLPFTGHLVAAGGPPDQPLGLYRVGSTPRVGELTTGIYGDGWMGSTSSYTRFGAFGGGPGRLTIVLGRRGWSGPDVPGHVTIALGRPASGTGGLATVLSRRRWTIHRLQQRTFVFTVRRAPVRAVVRVEPTFSPAQFPGYPDTRQLGAQIQFRFAPTRG